MRKTVLTQFALATIAAAPLFAQGMANDPTHKVMGSGQLPAGWMMRFDPVMARAGRPTPPTPQATDVNFVTMGPGLHATSGPAAIYYRPADASKGEYYVSATFAQSKSLQHEAFGLFIGGMNLQDSTQSYTYFVIRPMDGAILINHRNGDMKPTQLVAWTPNANVMKDDAPDGKATNKLMIHVAKDSVHFIANGKVVSALSKAQLGGPTDGVPGIRINHNIDIHIADYKVGK